MKLCVAVVFVLHLSNSVAFGNCSVDQERSLLEEIKTKLWLLEQLVQKTTESCKYKQATSGTTTTTTTTTTPEPTTTTEPKTTTTTEQSITTAEKRGPLCKYEYNLDPVTKICYKIYTVNKTWTEAMDFCTDQNARLLVLDDHMKFGRFRENLDLVSIAGSNAIQVGFKYSEKYDMFLWLSGKKVEDYTWGKNQPNYVGEMCGAIGLNWGGIPRMLHDADCDTERYYFICEKTE